jgi:class 3 adenylate cyclase
MEDGERRAFEPNDVMDLPPGHDAWVIGDERVVLIDIAGNSSAFGLPVSPSRSLATIVMTDIVSSTETAGRLGDAAWRQRLGEHNGVVRRQLERYGGREIDTTGDGFLAIFNSPAAALLAGVAIRDGVAGIDLAVRVGVHTGEIELSADDVSGIAVHATARVMAAARPSEVLTTPVTRALAEGAPLAFEDRGESELKGFAEPVRLFAVVPAA